MSRELVDVPVIAVPLCRREAVSIAVETPGVGLAVRVVAVRQGVRIIIDAVVADLPAAAALRVRRIDLRIAVVIDAIVTDLDPAGDDVDIEVIAVVPRNVLGITNLAIHRVGGPIGTPEVTFNGENRVPVAVEVIRSQ